ncbi:MAG: hypothetical protein DRP93_03875 [Candidatus Neomarinimicrobiota bacterium]|nr:MAG: hypothetical protein DRP93_03875 [Candidatus Neomarinimicrobiota bacterium]
MTNINVITGPASTLINLIGAPLQNGNSITWTIENDGSEAFKSSNVYRNTIDDRASATLIDTINQSSQYVDGEIVAGGVYYYWLRAINQLNQENGEWSSVNGLEITAKQVEQEDLGDSIGGDNYDFEDSTDFIVVNYLTPSGDEILWYRFLVGDSSINGLLATIDPFSQINLPSYVFNNSSGQDLKANVNFKIYSQPVASTGVTDNLTYMTASGLLNHFVVNEANGITTEDLLLTWSYTFGVDETKSYVIGVNYDKDRDGGADAISMVSNLRSYNITVA